MTASVATPESVVNLALARIGYRGRVSNLFAGSPAADAALDVYAQTRDEVLRSFDWGFAEKIAAAALSGQAAPAPWSISYSYPADCLKLRDLFNADYLADKNNPLPVLWTIASDAVAGKVILCNAAGATLVYTQQVTDPARWEPLFVNAFADELGRALAPSLSSMEAAKLVTETAKDDLPLAASVIG